MIEAFFMSKNTVRLSKAICMLVVVGLLITSCSSAKQRLIGKWRSDKTGEVIEFFKEGTVSVTPPPPLNITITGSYRLLDDDTIRIDLPGLFALFGGSVYDFRVTGDVLTLTAYGVSVDYVRAR
jgi:hypothetical protein